MKYLLLLILIVNTSFINTTQKYWIGHGDISYDKSKSKFTNAYWTVTKVIEALSEQEALGKFKKYIINKEGSCKAAQGHGDGDWFYVTEVRKEDIIK